MATTEVAVMARVKTVCEGLGYRVVDDLDIVRQPQAAADKVVTVRYSASTPIGGFGFTEEARGAVLVSVLRLVQPTYAAAKDRVWADGRTIYSAVVRDGAVTTGEYAVEDGGQAFEVDAPRGANYLIGRLRVPVNFEAVLTAS